MHKNIAPYDTIASLNAIAVEIEKNLPPIFSQKELTPDYLACLFTLATALRTSRPHFWRLVVDRLFEATIQHVLASSVYYSKRLRSALSGTEAHHGLSVLPILPFLTRQDLEEYQTEIRSRDVTYAFSSFTSGSSSARPMIVDRSSEEQHFIEQFFRAVQKGFDTTSQPIALNLANLYHGQTIEIPSLYRRITVSVSTLTGLRTARDLLVRQFGPQDSPRNASALGGSLIALLRLSRFLEADGYRPDGNISFVQSTSEYMTPRARKYLQAYWKCDIEDRFGLTETFTGAWKCHFCQQLHFEPYGVPEVVDVSSDAPLSSGRGHLVVTELYPFVQMTPMIRYKTGDLVEIVNAKCVSGLTSYRILGRVRDSIIYNGQIAIGSYEMLDILDEEADVYRRRVYASLPQELQEVGVDPMFELRQVDEGIDVRIYIRYDPLQFVSRAQELRAKIALALQPITKVPCRIHLLQGGEMGATYMF